MIFFNHKMLAKNEKIGASEIAQLMKAFCYQAWWHNSVPRTQVVEEENCPPSPKLSFDLHMSTTAHTQTHSTALQ